MTFDTAAITDVSIDAASETSTIGGTAATQLEQAILDAQTAEVDAIGGATHTSDAVLKAAADCVAQATGASTELPEVIMQAGTYKASAHGFSVAREVPVTVTVSDKLIQGIRVDQCAETGHILDAAKLIIPRDHHLQRHQGRRRQVRRPGPRGRRDRPEGHRELPYQ